MYNYDPYQNYQFQQQRYQPQFVQSGMCGRIVDDFNSINANDVPMNGDPAIFIKRDMSELQLRMWNGNGQIVQTTYKPQTDVLNKCSTNVSPNEEKLKIDLSDALTDLLDERFSRIEKLLKPTRTKKESENE